MKHPFWVRHNLTSKRHTKLNNKLLYLHEKFKRSRGLIVHIQQPKVALVNLSIPLISCCDLLVDEEEGDDQYVSTVETVGTMHVQRVFLH